MNLCIDIGNSRAKVALFHPDSDEPERLWIFDDLVIEKLKHLIQHNDVRQAILSTVAEPNSELELFLKNQMTYISLDFKTPLPFTNGYHTPKTLGRDRIASIAGAAHLYKGENVLVVDAGTCIKYDFIDHKKHYHGGSILPGIKLRYRSLNEFTARLPLIEKADLSDFIGKSTETSIRTGVQWGVQHEFDGFIRQYSKKYEKLHVLVTGGDAHFFETQLKSRIFVLPNLVLTGLNEILNYNAH